MYHLVQFRFNSVNEVLEGDEKKEGRELSFFTVYSVPPLKI